MANDDDQIPAKYRYGQISDRPVKSHAPDLPTGSYLGNKIKAAEAGSRLELERAQVERAENNVRFIEAQSKGALAQRRLETIDTEFEIIDAERADMLARTKLETDRAVEAGKTVISEFEAVQAQNEAARTRAEAERLEAELRKRQLQDRLDRTGGAGGGAGLDELKEQRRQLTEQRVAAMTELQSLMMDETDPAAALKEQQKRAVLEDVEEELRLVKRMINRALGFDD